MDITFLMLHKNIKMVFIGMKVCTICGMSWDNYGEWQLDHIVPISNGKNENEICELNYYTNLRPLWKHENLIKSNKMLIKN